MKKFSIYNFQFTKKDGFTLVETLVAISIFTTSIIVLMSVLGQGISDTGYAKKKIIAAYLAQEGIEYIRNIRDTNVLYNLSGSQAGWDKFKNDLSLSSCYLVAGCNITSLNVNSGANSEFVGIINVVNISSDETKILSAVSWIQGSGTYKITLSENLFNWIEQ